MAASVFCPAQGPLSKVTWIFYEKVLKNVDSSVEKQGGVAFFLIYYTHRDAFYYLPFEMLYYFWDRKLKGGRKSFRFDELNPEYFIPQKHGIMIPYLDMLQKDLDDRA